MHSHDAGPVGRPEPATGRPSRHASQFPASDSRVEYVEYVEYGGAWKIPCERGPPGSRWKESYDGGPRWVHSDPRGRAPSVPARHGAGPEGRASLAEPLRGQGAQVGMGGADRWIAPCDADSGLENPLVVNTPQGAE
jgi:hypothetical protein